MVQTLLQVYNFALSCKTEVFNPAPGDPLSWKIYFQPASAHLPVIFKPVLRSLIGRFSVFDYVVAKLFRIVGPQEQGWRPLM